jgi:hypothetical protein
VKVYVQASNLLELVAWCGPSTQLLNLLGYLVLLLPQPEPSKLIRLGFVCGNGPLNLLDIAYFRKKADTREDVRVEGRPVHHAKFAKQPSASQEAHANKAKKDSSACAATHLGN